MSTISGQQSLPTDNPLINFIELDSEKGKKFDEAVKHLGVKFLKNPAGNENSSVGILREGKFLSFVSLQDYQKIQNVFEKSFPSTQMMTVDQFKIFASLGGFLGVLKVIFADLTQKKTSKKILLQWKDQMSQMKRIFNDVLWPKFEEINKYIEVISLKTDELLKVPSGKKTEKAHTPMSTNSTFTNQKIVPETKEEASFLKFLKTISQKIDKQEKELASYNAFQIDTNIKGLERDLNYLSQKLKNLRPPLKSYVQEIILGIKVLINQYSAIKSSQI